MSTTYKVQSGDSLSKIAQKLGIKGGWQALWNANKSLITNPNYIQAGWNLSLPGQPTAASAGSTTTSAKSVASSTQPTMTPAPSQKIGDEMAKTIADPTREDFHARYGTRESLMPVDMFRQFGEQQINPEAMRQAARTISGYDRNLGASGAWRSGQAMRDRGHMVSDLERQRKEQIQGYVDTQSNLYTDWYNNQMQQYMTSKAPSDYKLEQFNVPGIGAPQTQLNTGNLQGNNSSFSLRDFTNLGGYAAPTQMWGS